MRISVVAGHLYCTICPTERNRMAILPSSIEWSYFYHPWLYLTCIVCNDLPDWDSPHCTASPDLISQSYKSLLSGDINSSLSVKVCSCWTPATHWSLERLLSLVSWSLLSQHQQLSQYWSCTSTNTLWSNRNKNNNNINLAHLITSTICKHWTQNTFNNCGLQPHQILVHQQQYCLDLV